MIIKITAGIWCLRVTLATRGAPPAMGDPLQLLELGLGSVGVMGTDGKTCPVHRGAEESLQYCVTDVFRVNTV